MFLHLRCNSLIDFEIRTEPSGCKLWISSFAKGAVNAGFLIYSCATSVTTSILKDFTCSLRGLNLCPLIMPTSFPPTKTSLSINCSIANSSLILSFSFFYSRIPSRICYPRVTYGVHKRIGILWRIIQLKICSVIGIFN